MYGLLVSRGQGGRGREGGRGGTPTHTRTNTSWSSLSISPKRSTLSMFPMRTRTRKGGTGGGREVRRKGGRTIHQLIKLVDPTQAKHLEHVPHDGPPARARGLSGLLIGRGRSGGGGGGRGREGGRGGSDHLEGGRSGWEGCSAVGKVTREGRDGGRGRGLTAGLTNTAAAAAAAAAGAEREEVKTSSTWEEQEESEEEAACSVGGGRTPAQPRGRGRGGGGHGACVGWCGVEVKGEMSAGYSTLLLPHLPPLHMSTHSTYSIYTKTKYTGT